MSDRDMRGRRRPVSATDAAFAGFTLARERPVLFFSLMALIVLLGLAVSFAQVLIAGPALTRLLEMQAAGASSGFPPDPTATLQLMGPIWRSNLVVLPLTLLFYATANAAVYRAMLRPAQSGFGYLRLGSDELRQVGTLILFSLTMIGLGILVQIGGVIVAVAAGLILRGVDVSAGARAAVVIVVTLLCTVAPFLLIAVRLSLAGPMTFAQRRVRLTGSWTVTRGRFWTMFGAYCLAGFVMAVLAILVLVLLCLFAYALGGGVAGVRSLFIPDSSSMATFFTPTRIVMLVLNAPVGALWIGMQAAVPGNLYLQIAGGPDPAFADPDRSHSFGSPPPTPPSAPNPPLGDFPITTPRTPPSDEL